MKIENAIVKFTPAVLKCIKLQEEVLLYVLV